MVWAVFGVLSAVGNGFFALHSDDVFSAVLAGAGAFMAGFELNAWLRRKAGR